ncbi:MAG: peptidyl-alpha-hydroxyglycine alpha-amidating lyase family protein [Chloroflexi bacterium]|nr:peptidyl-alpha-hydroxyglycine alpha-amidating lyase family protein [Chloroflexota bacterium]
MHTPSAWHPHEGSLLQMRADTRFGADGLPDGWWFGRVSAVVTDSDGLVYVAHRGPAGDPIIVLDQDGRYVRSWGRGRIGLAHGLRLAPDGALWLTDVLQHEVTRWEPDGTLTLSLGTVGVAGTDDQCFDRPTDVAFSPSGDVFVSDGYGNSRVVRFSPDGRRLGSFGKRGTGPAGFHTPHSVVFGPDGLLYVSDRTNQRIQRFDADGGFRGSWDHLGATQCLDFGNDGSLWAVTFRSTLELVAQDALGGRLMRLDPVSGEVIAAVDANGHGVHRARSGDVFVASLAGSVIRFMPDWPTADASLDEHEVLSAALQGPNAFG